MRDSEKRDDPSLRRWLRVVALLALACRPGAATDPPPPLSSFDRFELAAVALDEGLPAGPDLAVLLEGALPVLGMDELEHRLRLQFGVAEPEHRLPRRVEPLEIAAEVRDAEHVDRQGEEATVQV